MCIEKVVLSISGGLDSTTVLKWLIDHRYEVIGVHFQYGSKHNPFEYEAMIKVAQYFKIPLHTINLKEAFSEFRSNLLVGQGELPTGHYSQESISLTEVPNRNAIFLNHAAGFAMSIGASKIGIGVHVGNDRDTYPDCKPEFIKAMDTAIYLGTGGKVEIIAPFKDTTKAGIVKYGLAHNVPYELTRSCYSDQEVSCANCSTCLERREAFKINGVEDSIQYA